MQNEIKVLKDKVESLNDEMKTLDRLNTERAIENLNIKFKLETCESGVVTIIESWESKLYQCESGNQNGVISRKELELCRKELSDEQNSKDHLNKTLQNVEESLEALKDENNALQNQLTSEKAKNENLQNQIRELEKENTRIKSELPNNRRETTNNLRPMTTITTSSMPRTTNANFADNVLVLSTYTSSNKPMTVDFFGE